MKEPIVEAFKQEQEALGKEPIVEAHKLEQEAHDQEWLEKGERLLAAGEVRSWVRFVSVIAWIASILILMFGLISRYGG